MRKKIIFIYYEKNYENIGSAWVPIYDSIKKKKKVDKVAKKLVNIDLRVISF